MPLLKSIEEKVIFRFTRSIALIVIVLLVVFSLIGLVKYFQGERDTYVLYEDIKKSLTSVKEEATTSIQENVPEIKIPENVEKYLGGENKKVLLGWIEQLDDHQKEDFIKNISDVISLAEKDNPEKVVDIINGYKILKFGRLPTSEIEKYVQKTQKGVVGLSILLMVGLVGLFSLVLVLLAVERNTRGK